MRCINCGIAIQRLKRHLISSLSAHHQTRLSRWLTNAQTQLPLDTFICQPCFLLLNTEAGEYERLLGHNMVCLGCGKSLRKIRHHNVSMDSPLLAVLISQNSINVPSRNNYICHVCWMRTNRQAGQDLSPKLQELGPDNIQESDNNEAIPNVQVVSPPEPPPLQTVLNRFLQKAVQDHGARKTEKILCPNCNTEIQIPQNKEDKVNAMIVNVYQYFAKEGTGLTGAQLRQRTALCTGASEADVECALVLEHEKSTDEGNPAMSQNPPRKRRRKGSESPPPEQEEEPYVEQETLIVKIEPNADDGSNEINPLAIDKETPPYSMTEPGHICLKDGSCCNPLQIQPNVINAATVFVKEEPKEETNADQPVENISLPVHACDSDSSDAPSDQAMSQSYQPKQSNNKGPTPDNPLDSCSHIKTEEINIEDSCCSDTDSEGYS